MTPIADLRKNVWIRLVLVLAGLVLLVALLSAVKTVLIFFLVAFIAAYICDPIIDAMEARKIPRTVGVSLLSIALLGGTGLFWLIAIPLFQVEVTRLTSDVPEYINRAITTFLPWFENTFGVRIPAGYNDWMANFQAHDQLIRQYAAKFSAPVWSVVSRMFSSVTNMITGLLGAIVIPVAWFYLLRDIDPIKRRIFEFVPPRHREGVGGFLGEVDQAISNFMRGQIVVMFILALLYIIGLEFIVKVPLGFLIGLFAGFASIVPYLGLILGILPALILAFLEYGDWLHPLGVILVFTVAQVAEGTLITPKVVGDKLGMHPVTVIFAILIWGELLGFIGILIAVPVTAVLIVAIKRIVAAYFSSGFFSEPTADSSEPKDP